MLRIDPKTNAVEMCCPWFLRVLSMRVFEISHLGTEYPEVNLNGFDGKGIKLSFNYCPYCGKPFNPNVHGKKVA